MTCGPPIGMKINHGDHGENWIETKTRLRPKDSTENSVSSVSSVVNDFRRRYAAVF